MRRLMSLAVRWGVVLLVLAGSAGWCQSAARTSRPPAPDLVKQRAAEKLVRELFSREYAKLALADRLALGRLLLEKSKETNDDLAVKYVLLREAYRLAMDGGEAQLAIDALDGLAATFEVAVQTERNAAVFKLESAVRTPEQAKPLVGACLARADQCVRADQYEAAQQELAHAERLARTVRATALEAEVRGHVARVQELARAAAPFQAAFARLKVDPQDPEANTAAGVFQCFHKQDWERGLPLLARGANKELKNAALAELGPPANAEQQIAVGNRWWEWGQHQPAKYKHLAWSRADDWYRQALPGLSGVTQMRLEKRRKELGELLVNLGPRLGGVQESGNVALARNGTQVTGPTSNPQALLDGITKGYDRTAGFAMSACPAVWTITFAKVYLLSELRILFWDGDDRFYRYAIETSADGTTYRPLIDRHTGKWRSWQQISFPPTPVKAVRLHVLFNSANPQSHVVEFEAYCTPPAEAVHPRFRSEGK